jgi:glutamate formiminotransferase / formiminotetrahydrofolate cyclodeaminase
MAKIIECVPNISNGNNPEIYQAVAQAAAKVPGVALLDVDPGISTNRTVITFAGPPEAVLEAAFQVIKKAKELIDMRQHQGEHPRMGACDVCPFVPVSETTMEECAALARALGQRVGKELGVWVYLYEAAATSPERQNLAYREWLPDYGPPALNAQFGAVAIGARKFLVAYNINLNTTNKKMANDMAMNIRESGRQKRESYPDGPIVKNPDGTAVQIPGRFKHCKATAWIIPEYQRAQITMNLTDIDTTPLHEVFDDVCRQASERGLRVTGSEIVGLVPLKVLLEAGRFFLRKQGMSAGQSEADLLSTAILSLGLNDVAPFKMAEKIIEYRLRPKIPRLSLSVGEFADLLASDAPAPGGGSVAALCGTLSSALAAMASNLTHGKKEYQALSPMMEDLGIEAQELKNWFRLAIDHDTEAFGQVMQAMSLPKNNEAEKQKRQAMLEKAQKEAAEVPFQVLLKAQEVLPLLETLAEQGNRNCASDIGVGLYCLLSCAEGAAMNVKINLKNIPDSQYTAQLGSALAEILPSLRERLYRAIETLNAAF